MSSDLLNITDADIWRGSVSLVNIMTQISGKKCQMKNKFPPTTCRESIEGNKGKPLIFL
jgi:hypothetical protein